MRGTTPNTLSRGEAVVTTGGALHARYVIHTVGPVKGVHGDRDAELLALCYRNSLTLALEYGLTSLAFPAISTGIYGYPREKAAVVASKAIAEFLGEVASFREIRLVFFSQSDLAVFLKHQLFGVR
jgi:O-acetyl-ADP-ribose deacetylase